MRSIALALLLITLPAFADSYSVPAPAELASEATWQNVTAEARLVGNELTIRYDLPTDLVGTVSTEFIAKGQATSSFVQVSGPGVYGTCMRAKDLPLTCMLKYPRSIVDVTTRDTSLASHFQGDQLEKRSTIARLFGADPAGLLSVELK